MSLAIDVSTTTERFVGDLETSHIELKKQSDKAKRFANPDINKHPHAEQISYALKVLQPEQLLKVLQSASLTLSKTTPESSDEVRRGIPQLAPTPFDEARLSGKQTTGDEGKELSGNALMFSLLGKIMQLTNDTSLQNLLGQLKFVNASFAGSLNQFNALAAQLEKCGEQWANDVDALKAAQEQANALEHQSAQAESMLQASQGYLDDLQAQAAQQLKETGVVDPELRDRIEQATCGLAEAKLAAAAAKTAHEQFLVNVLGPARQAEKDSKSALQQVEQQAQQALRQTSGPQRVAIESQRKQQDDNAKSLEFLMAIIAQLINKSASEELSASAALKQKLSEAAAKDAEIKALEYAKEVKKAEELQKTMGCIGKVIGWAITVVGVAAAVFTGGASLALAGIGLALALGDEICKATTGVSYLERAMRPIMEHIVKPLMELMAKIYSAVLEAVGFSKEAAAMVGQIMGAIAAAVILIAGTVVAGKMMSKLTSMLIEKVGSTVVGQVTRQMTQKMVQKLLNSSVGQFFKRFSNGLGRELGMQETHIAQITTGIRAAQQLGGLTNTIIQTAGTIAVSDTLVEAEKARAQMTRDVALQEILKALMEHVVDKFAQQLAVMKAIIENMASAAESRMQAGKYVARKIGAVAG